jgi:hypothetical protein
MTRNHSCGGRLVPAGQIEHQTPAHLRTKYGLWYKHAQVFRCMKCKAELRQRVRLPKDLKEALDEGIL